MRNLLQRGITGTYMHNLCQQLGQSLPMLPSPPPIVRRVIRNFTFSILFLTVAKSKVRIHSGFVYLFLIVKIIGFNWNYSIEMLIHVVLMLQFKKIWLLWIHNMQCDMGLILQKYNEFMGEEGKERTWWKLKITMFYNNLKT